MDLLPPLQTSATAAPPAPPVGGFAQPQTPQNPGIRGRPLADSDAQNLKVERAADVRRLENLLPKQAVDSKVLIFRLRDGEERPSASAKPRITILISELEKAQTEDGVDSAGYIEQRINEKHDSGRFFCKVVDRKGNMIQSFHPWIVDLDEEEDLDDEDDENNDESALDEPIQPHAPAPWPQMPTYQPPPAPQPLDTVALMQMQREAREESERKSGDVMQIIASMNQSSTQMLVALQETARREAAAREERDEKRRQERNQMLLALLPTVLPMVKEFLAPKKQEGMSPEMLLLVETLKAKDNSGHMKDMMSFMFEASKAQTSLQAQAAQTALATQADMMSVVNKNIMDQLKNIRDSSPSDGGGGMMETIGKVAGPLLAAMAQQPQQAPPPSFQPAPQPAPAPAIEHQATPVIAHQPAPQRQPVVKTPPPAAPPKAEPAAPQLSEDQRVAGCLQTVMHLSQGKIPPTQLWDALRWCVGTMPDSLKNAIRADSESQVMTLGTNAVMASPELLTWVAETENLEFLRTSVRNMRLLITGQLDATAVAAATQEHAQWLARAKTPTQAEPIAQPTEMKDAVVMPQEPAAQPPIEVVEPAAPEQVDTKAETVALPTKPAKKQPPKTKG